MKSSYIRAIIVCATLYTAYQMQAAATLQTIKRAIDESSTEVFGARLYKQPFSNAAALPWTQAVAQASDFITDMQNSMNNPDMLALYKNIKTANDELISLIQVAYNDLFRSNQPTDSKKVSEIEAKFDKIKNKMTDTENALNALNRDRQYVIPQQEEVRALLFALASKIKANASIAQNQIEAEIAQRAADAKASAKQKAKAKAEKATAQQKAEQETAAQAAKQAQSAQAGQNIEQVLAGLDIDNPPMAQTSAADLPQEHSPVVLQKADNLLEELDRKGLDIKNLSDEELLKLAEQMGILPEEQPEVTTAAIEERLNRRKTLPATRTRVGGEGSTLRQSLPARPSQ